MAGLTPFAPTGPTVNLSVTDNTSNLQFNTLRSTSVRIYNTGSEAVYIAFGGSAVATSTSAGMPIAPGTVETFSCNGQSYIAGVALTAGPSVIFVTPGEGA